MSVWRLIPPLVASGVVQMAIDRWLLEQHALGRQPSTLRFYTWSPVAISLGYHQHRYPEFWQTLTWQGAAIAVVKRPSGGRAVLHQGDLTYAVITSGLTPQRRQAYEQICRFLMMGWQTLGVTLHYGQAGRGYIHNPDCFGTATAADLVMSDGAKLIGSAQLRRNQAILQHGSMRLQPDPALFRQVFGPDDCHLPDWERSRAERTPPPLPVVIAALTQAAQQCFAMELAVQPLTPDEWAAAVSMPLPPATPL